MLKDLEVDEDDCRIFSAGLLALWRHFQCTQTEAGKMSDKLGIKVLSLKCQLYLKYKAVWLRNVQNGYQIDQNKV